MERSEDGCSSSRPFSAVRPSGPQPARRRGKAAGFAEEGQEGYGIGPGRKLVEDVSGDLMTEKDNEAGLSFYERVRGCMKGTITIMPGTDLTAPTDPEWAKVYDDD